MKTLKLALLALVCVALNAQDLVASSNTASTTVVTKAKKYKTDKRNKKAKKAKKTEATDEDATHEHKHEPRVTRTNTQSATARVVTDLK